VIDGIDDVGSWHEATQNDVRSHVGYEGISGRVMLTLSFVDRDPTETLAARFAVMHNAAFSTM
jgi:hypothetical protein